MKNISLLAALVFLNMRPVYRQGGLYGAQRIRYREIPRLPYRTKFRGGQNCRKYDLLPKILSAEKFCPPKILSAEIFCPLKFKICQMNTNLILNFFFPFELYGELRNR